MAGLSTLVTGASSGIGRAIAARLANSRSLILHGRDLDRLEETLRMCAGPERHAVWTHDLRDVAAIGAGLAGLLAESGRRVEAFVHCAGVAPVVAMRSTSHCVVQETMNVNFASAAEIVGLLLKQKVNERRLANVVFISSIYSRLGARGHAAYCASKAALDGLMRALAVELAPAVRVNSILPGAVATEMAKGAFEDPEIVAKFERDYPLGVGSPQSVADAVEFVLSDQARWFTGQQMVVDGGRSVNASQS